ncbi:MAG: DUF4292 domain-containing protein [Balneolaceae bacterium]
MIMIMTGCRTSHQLIETGNLQKAEISPNELLTLIPDYRDSLNTLSGNGRALVSQPGNSDRVTLEFYSDRDASLVTVRNRLGIEGAQILVKKDSVLVYNRIDEIAESSSLKEGNLSQIGSLATVNLLNLFHFPVTRDDIRQIFEDENYYVAILKDQTRVTIDQKNGRILDIRSSENSNRPYSQIIYEAYEQLNGFYLPRKITIFSMDGTSKVTLLVRQLEVNRSLPPLKIQLPEDTLIQTL